MNQIQIPDQRSPDLVDLMPLTAKRVIDIGCGIGKIAKEFRTRATPEYYLGVEMIPEYARIASEFCSECIVGNIEEFDSYDWSKLTNYDLWVFGDVLEHMYDPWKILKNVREVLPKGGQIICCIPNVQHWSLQSRLSIGDWRYADGGLLDRTHLRFFTRATIIELLQGAGFEMTGMKPRILPDPDSDKFLDIIEKLAATTGGDPYAARIEASIFQFIVQAQ